MTMDGVFQYKIRHAAIVDDLTSTTLASLKEGSRARKFFEQALERATKVGALKELDHYVKTTLVQGAAQAKKAVGDLIGAAKVVLIRDSATLPNPKDMPTEAYKDSFRHYDPASDDIESFLNGLDALAALYTSIEVTSGSVTEVKVDKASLVNIVVGELEFNRDWQTAVHDFKWAQQSDYIEYTAEQMYNQLKDDLLAFQRKRRDYDDKHSSRSKPAGPAVAVPAAAMPPADPEIRDCNHGDKCHKGAADCIYTHRDANGNVINNPAAARERRFGSNWRDGLRSNRGRGGGRGGKRGGGRGGRGGRGDYWKRKQPGKDKTNPSKKGKFTEADMKKFAEGEVTKHNQRVTASNGDTAVALPAVKISDVRDFRAHPTRLEMVAAASGTADFFEEGTLIGVDTDANVGIANSMLNLKNVRDVPSAAVTGVGNKTYQKMADRVMVLPRPDGKMAIVVDKVYVDIGGAVNVTPALRLAELGYPLKLCFADEPRLKYKKPGNKSSHALRCPDGVPIWLEDKNGCLVLRQALVDTNNIDLSLLQHNEQV
eukprot:g5462.t1